MQYIRYQTPQHLPCYRDWDFRVLPGVFELQAPAVLSHLRESRKTMLSHWPDLNHANRCINALEQLIPNTADESFILLEQDLTEGLWIAAGSLIPERKYRNAFCPECDKWYTSSQILTHKWSFGEYLAASGGERYACKADHTLYSLMHWNS